VLGLLVAFKPNLAPCAGFLLLGPFLRRQWCSVCERLLGILLGGIFAVTCAAYTFGSFQCWSHWLTSLRELMGTFRCSAALGNFSLVTLLEDFWGYHSSLWLLIGGLAAGILVMLLGCRGDATDESAAQRDADYRGVSFGVLVMTTSSVLVWYHYYLLLIPALLYLLRPAAQTTHLRNSLGGQSVAWLAAILVIEFRPLMSLIIPRFVSQTIPEYDVLRLAVNLGLILVCSALLLNTRPLRLRHTTRFFPFPSHSLSDAPRPS
jgi:hypothetical protein